MSKKIILLFAPLFSFMLSISAWGACQDPSSISPSTITTTMDTAKSGQFTASGQTTPYYFSTTLRQNPAHGTATIARDGSYTYTPATGFTGSDSFVVRAIANCDSSKRASFTINVTVKPATPTCSAPSISSQATLTTNINTAITHTAPSVSGGSTPFVYSASITTLDSAAGSLTINSSTGQFTYTPGPNYTGPYNFTLRVSPSCDSTKVASTPITISVVDSGSGGACAAPTINAIGRINVTSGIAYSATPSASGGTPPYVYSITAQPTHGTLVINNTTTGNYTYTPVSGYTGSDSFTLAVASTGCPSLTTSSTASVVIGSASATGNYTNNINTGNVATNGAIIIDNTPNPGTPGVVTNMSTNMGGKQFGSANAFNINAIQVMQRDITTSPHSLVDEIGVNNAASTSYQNYGTSRQTTYFANGQHLFDLDRLRRAADWMSTNITPTPAGTTCTLVTTFNSSTNTGTRVPIGTPVGSCHPVGTYGTISWHQFLDNIANNRTMYGVIRVIVPLQLGTAASTNNALNQTVGSGQIYGFCSGIVGLCADAPTSSTDVKPGVSVAGNNSVTVTIPANGQIRVRGSLMLDFVNGAADTVYPNQGTPIDLAHLPFQPRDIYFKVSVPINVNAANDMNGDGALDNIDYINELTAGVNCPSFPCTAIIPNTTQILVGQVPQEAIDAYNYQFGANTFPSTQSAFGSLNMPNQYHLLMASGYAQGWADAFAELSISANQWEQLGFTIPPNISDKTVPLSVTDIRSSAFEDIPVYLYTGGLVDMHHHLNASGLVYVPQALELEAKQATTRQYVMGGFIVRDGFFLEAKPGTVTLISSDPSSFASMKVNAGAIQGAMLTSATTSLHNTQTGSTAPVGIGVGGGNQGSGSGGTGGQGGGSGMYGGNNSIFGGAGGAATARKVRWIEIRPR